MHHTDNIFFWNDKSYDSRLLPKREKGEINNCMKDYFPFVKLAAEPAKGRITAVNSAIQAYLHPEQDAVHGPKYSFFPPLYRRISLGKFLITAQMTGGRTFTLTEESCHQLGIPPYFYLDLEKVGWGKGILELKLEIKGAGSFLSKAKIDQNLFVNFIEQDPEFRTAYSEVRGTDHELLVISPASFLKRHIGGQTLKLAKHAVETSNKLIGNFPIKFLPSILAIRQPDELSNAIYKMSSLIDQKVSVCEELIGNDIRLTAGNVRAMYFDNAQDDNELRWLIYKISEEENDLEETLSYMIEDVRKHMEVIATSTQPIENEAFAWVKIGDINEMFEMESWYRKQDYSHVLSKDEIIVNKLGKFFTDMESLYGKDIGYKSESHTLMIFHHELAILCILRDHIRVCTKFGVAKELCKRNDIPRKIRKEIQNRIISQIMENVNSSPHLQLEISPTDFIVSFHYCRLNMSHTFHIPRWQIAEPY